MLISESLTLARTWNMPRLFNEKPIILIKKTVDNPNTAGQYRLRIIGEKESEGIEQVPLSLFLSWPLYEYKSLISKIKEHIPIGGFRSSRLFPKIHFYHLCNGWCRVVNSIRSFPDIPTEFEVQSSPILSLKEIEESELYKEALEVIIEDSIERDKIPNEFLVKLTSGFKSLRGIEKVINQDIENYNEHHYFGNDKIF